MTRQVAFRDSAHPAWPPAVAQNRQGSIAALSAVLDLFKASERAMDAAEREMQVRKFGEEVWNDRNYQAVSDLYGKTYVNPFGTGPAARAEPIRRYHQAFPDLHLDIEELIVAGDTVVLRAALRGTDTGGYAGRAATGRAVEEWVVTILHFDGDRVVREWVGADKLGLFIQLGVVENPWPD
jgi:predicted ester cyclase